LPAQEHPYRAAREEAVYKRAHKCACVGGSSNVPLGFVSLTEKSDDDRHGAVDGDGMRRRAPIAGCASDGTGTTAAR
jgi:hypothetical protein